MYVNKWGTQLREMKGTQNLRITTPLVFAGEPIGEPNIFVEMQDIKVM